MYAVIETSGRQYRVELGNEIELDQLDAEPGSTIELGRVLLVADGDQAHIGRPVVDGARVTGEVLRQDRGEKIVVFKYRPKARTRVKHGHRANLTIVRVSDIVLNGRSAADEAKAQAKKDAEARQAAEKEAARKAAADQALAAKLAADEATDDDAAAEAPDKAPSKPATKAGAKAGAAKPAAKRGATTTAAAKPAKTAATDKPAKTAATGKKTSTPSSKQKDE